ncbi:MAG: type II secretion system F family protein [Acidimicrobiia bacterium]
MTTILLVVTGTAVSVALVVAARRADGAAHARHLRHVPWEMPAALRHRLAGALAAADVDTTPEAAVQACAIGAAACAIVAVAVAPTLVVPATVAALLAGPVWLRLASARQERRFVRALPGGLEQVASELRGGGSVATAIEHLGAASSPVARDARRVHTRTTLGLGLADSLAVWPTEHDAPGVRAAAGALAVAATMGGHAADALDRLASSLRDRLDAVAEAQALSTQARLSAVVVGAAPLGYLAFASLVDARSVSALVGTGVGRVCLVVGVALEALAAVWMRRIVASEPA